MWQERKVDARGLRIHVFERSAGTHTRTPVLLVHGMLVDHREWNALATALAPKFSLIAPDLPGCGASERPDPDRYPYTAEAFAVTLADILRATGHERVHVCGHSMGGAIALTFAALFPQFVERLAVIDAAAVEFPLPAKARLPLIPGVGKLVFKYLYSRATMRDYFKHDVWNDAEDIDLALVDSYYASLDAPLGRETAYATLVRTLDTTSVEQLLPKVTCPTLVLWGEHDRIVPLDAGTRLAERLPDARLSVVAGCGHAPNEQAAEQCAEQLVNHFHPN